MTTETLIGQREMATESGCYLASRHSNMYEYGDSRMTICVVLDLETGKWVPIGKRIETEYWRDLTHSY